MVELEPAPDAMNLPVSLQSPWPLLVLLLVPLLAWLSARTHAHLSRRHLATVTLLRCLAVALLALALARPQWNSGSEDVSVVYALDVSRSVAPQFIESALGWIGEADRQGRPAQ